MLLSASVPNRKSLAGRSHRYYGESEGITLTFGEGCRSIGNNTAPRCPISLTRHAACSLAPLLTPSLPFFLGLRPHAGAVGKRYVSRSRQVTWQARYYLAQKPMLSQLWAAEAVGFRVANSNWHWETRQEEEIDRALCVISRQKLLIAPHYRHKLKD